MSNLSCPFPENVNPLSPNGFMFGINLLPEMKYFCQQASIPTVSLPSVEQSTQFVNIFYKGTTPSFDALNIQFLVDSRLDNYKALMDWMLNGFPKQNEPEKTHSDGFLQILDSSNNVVRTIKFVDLIPTSLDAITFSSVNTDVQYVVGSATFAYTYFCFE